MVWGYFSNHKVGDLGKLEGIMTKESSDPDQTCYIPFGKRLISQNFAMQYDNNPKHTFKFCKTI